MSLFLSPEGTSLRRQALGVRDSARNPKGQTSRIAKSVLGVVERSRSGVRRRQRRSLQEGTRFPLQDSAAAEVLGYALNSIERALTENQCPGEPRPGCVVRG